MSLSVCMIVKNEERHLARALESVRGVADQIVVVDTGSTDQTVQIAERFGARVVHFVWSDHFAAARNFAIGQAACDWILMIDADEELLPESQEELRQAIARDQALGVIILLQELHALDPVPTFTEMWLLRMYRRRDDIRLKGRLHEHFEPPLFEIAKREGKRVLESTIRLRHYGLLESDPKAKLARNLPLLKLELDEKPGDLYCLIEYGRTLLQVGDQAAHSVLAQAAEQVLAARDQPRAPLPMVISLLEYLLFVPPAESRSRLTRAEATDLALRWFPDCAPLLWQMARNAFHDGSYQQAAVHLERLLGLGRTGRYDKSLSFDPLILGDEAVMNLGACYSRMGAFDRAAACFRQLLGSRSKGTQAAQLLAQIQAHKDNQASSTP